MPAVASDMNPRSGKSTAPVPRTGCLSRPRGYACHPQQALKPRDEVMRGHMDNLAIMRSSAMARRMSLILQAKERVKEAAAAAQSSGASIDATQAALYSDSEASGATSYWRKKISSASTIEEITRLELAFKGMKKIETEVAEAVGYRAIRSWHV